MPRFENSIAALSYNRGGQLLAVASSHTYQEANELLAYLVFYFTILFHSFLLTNSKGFKLQLYKVLLLSEVENLYREIPPRIYILEMNDQHMSSFSAGRSK